MFTWAPRIKQVFSSFVRIEVRRVKTLYLAELSRQLRRTLRAITLSRGTAQNFLTQKYERHWPKEIALGRLTKKNNSAHCPFVQEMATFLRRTIGNLVKRDETPSSLTLSRPEGSITFSKKELKYYSLLLTMLDSDADGAIGGACELRRARVGGGGTHS